MSKKVFNLIVGISGGVATIACALVAFFDPAYESAIMLQLELPKLQLLRFVQSS